MIPGSGRCHYHPARVGVGICVECRRVICTECTTQFEGINRCAQCLAAKLKTSAGGKVRPEWSVGNVLLALVGISLLFGGVFATALLVTTWG
jgi:hypothetical protein